MNEKYIQISGITLTILFGMFIAWLYWTQPKTIKEVPLKAQTTIENVTTATQVITKTYEVDAEKFAEGLLAFREDNFVSARDYFERADPENLDAKTQFYIAYSFYRQGWGRVSSDDELFKKGLDQTEKVIILDKDFKTDDADLKLQTPAELKNEFEEGLRVTAEDFNPFKLVRERK